ncbi:MAG: outer membrane beta-barrel protein [Marinomonas sp.]
MIKRTMVASSLLYATTNLVAAPQYYGILEIGSAKSKFSNIDTAIPESTATTDVISDSDSSSFFSVGVGVDWEGSPLRSEVVYTSYGDQSFIDDTVFSASSDERTTTTIRQESLMFNVLYDIDFKNDVFKPYVGAGVGIQRSKVSAEQLDSPVDTGRSASFAETSDTNFMWSVVLGANYSVTEKAIIGFGYRYIDAGKVSTGNNCVGSDALICDTDEQHSADQTSNLLFANMNYYF